MEMSADGKRVYLHTSHWLAETALADGATVWYAMPYSAYATYTSRASEDG